MTSRERVLKALHFEKPDRMPFEISWDVTSFVETAKKSFYK